MDYIHPATCTESEYRVMWSEFEWENKVGVNTLITDVDDFLDHIIQSTNMNCLTPRFERGQSTFLAANLYAKSVFGEDALVNVSVEKVGAKVEGYIRIRAKTQGIALSIGDRITLVQKSQEKK
jgi:coatomer subunit beta